MIIKKSPGGSTFPYHYKGGAIHCLKYGSFFANKAALLELIKAEEVFISEKPHQRLRIWVDFYETQLTDHVLMGFIDSSNRLRHQIIRMAIVGCSFKDKQRFHKLSKKRGITFSVPTKFFHDPEVAKTWLVSESS